MGNVLAEIIPIIAIFLIGYVLRKAGVLKTEDGDLLLKIIFYLSLPALIIFSIASVKLSKEFLFIPFIAMWIILTTFFISFFLERLFFSENKSLGTFLVGSVTMEVSFVIPFIVSTYGNEGVARVILFDLGSSLLVFSFVYFIACRYGDNTKNSNSRIMKKVIFSPPILAATMALALNLLDFQMPQVAVILLKDLGSLTIPLIMLSVGVYFNPKFEKFLPLFSAVFVRMFVGLSAGFILINLFNLDGLTKEIILIASAAPICYNIVNQLNSSVQKCWFTISGATKPPKDFVGLLYLDVLVFRKS